MAEKRMNFPVNWIDGMKINKNHFISTDNNITRQIMNFYSSFLNPYNYGLLAAGQEGSTEAFKVIIDMDNQGFIHAKVMNCVAVTRDGSRIEIKESTFDENDLSATVPQAIINPHEKNAEEYFIAITVQPFERIPFGIPHPEEIPPRLPYVLPGYHLSVYFPEDRDSFKSHNSLTIGRIVFAGNKPELDDNFIPPCQIIYSHPKLVEFHAQLVKVMGQVEIDIIDILAGIKNKKQSTSIAGTVSEIAEAVLNFMNIHLVEFRKIALYKPPIYLFEIFAAFARTINNAINKQPAAEKEELLNYIQDWSSLKQGEFENLIINTIEYKYNHNNINQAINSLVPFVNSISKICNTLSNLDFIGKKKDMHIFVKEQKEKPGSSFLVD